MGKIAAGGTSVMILVGNPAPARMVSAQSFKRITFDQGGRKEAVLKRRGSP